MKPSSLIIWFIPEVTQQDIVSFTRAKVFVGIVMAMSLICFLSTPRGYVIAGFLTGVLVFCIACLMVSSLFMLKKTGSISIAGNYFLLFYYLLMMLLSFQTGGVSSAVPYNLTVVVILGFLFTGLRNGVFWGLFCLVSVIALNLMEINGYKFPPLKAEDPFINTSVLIVMTLVVTGLYELSNTTNLKKYAEERANSEKAADNLRIILDETDSVMSAASKGDLSKKMAVETKGRLDRLKESVNTALGILGKAIFQVNISAQEIDGGTSQLSDSAQSFANGTIEQAASLEEISSSMDEIGSMAKKNCDSASQAQLLSNQTAEKAIQGNKQMETMLVAMNTINQTSTNVSKVIKVIDEIAFQTNLLALNAAVEAARAGKYGKGFAVVAEEVRNLAARSAEAAKDTTQLIEKSIKEVENGVKNADQTAEILKGFVESLQKVNSFIEDISIASKEQDAGVTEINANLSQVNTIVQQNASISEEIAASLNELSSQAEFLKQEMSKFRYSS